MKIARRPFSELIRSWSFPVITVVVLFIACNYNIWGTGSQAFSFDDLSQNMMVADLLHDQKFNQDNWFIQTTDDNPLAIAQYTGASTVPPKESAFRNYYSQIGIHGSLYHLVDVVLPISNITVVAVLKVINALLLALLLTIFVLWIKKRTNVYVAVMLLLVLAGFSEDLTKYGRNLYWVGWTLVVPFIASILVVERGWLSKPTWRRTIFLFSAAMIAFKLLFYFEFVSSVALALVVPLIYCGVYERTAVKKSIQMVVWSFLGTIAGFIAASVLKMVSLYQVSHSWGEAFRLYLYPITYRISGAELDYDPTLAPHEIQSLHEPVMNVIHTYLSTTMHGVFGITYSYQDLIVVYILFGLLGYALVKRGTIEQKAANTIRALIAATTFSILAPLSWFVLAKPHAFIHVAQCLVLWHIPFTLFGTVLVLFVLYLIVERVLETLRF